MLRLQLTGVVSPETNVGSDIVEDCFPPLQSAVSALLLSYKHDWGKFSPADEYHTLELGLVASRLLKPPLRCGRSPGVDAWKNPYNAAVCIYGSERVNTRTVATFKRYLYGHLSEPDLFMYMAPQKGIPPELKRYVDEWKSLAKKYERAVDVDYKAFMAKNKGYSECLDDNRNWNNNWNGGWPKSAQPKASIMHQHHGVEMCGEMIRESERQRGKKYDWVILSRADHEYYAPHPVLGDLDPNYAYIPSGSDWFGVNDRHGIYPRDYADVRFNFHESLLKGTFNCSWMPDYSKGFINTEMVLKSLLDHSGVKLMRYPPVSHIGCTQPSTRCHSSDRGPYADEIQRYILNEKTLSLHWRLVDLEGKLLNQYLRCACSPAIKKEKPNSELRE